MPRKPEKIIEILIQPDGSSTIEAVGFQGKGCKDATAPYESALGVVTARQDKPEMRQAETAARPVRTVRPGQ